MDRNPFDPRHVDPAQRLDLILADAVSQPGARVAKPHDLSRVAPMQVKAGYMILCVSGDPAFAHRTTRTAEADNAHTALAWSAEDLENLPIWGFHGAICDQAEAERLAATASPRVRARLASIPTVIATESGPEAAVKSLIQLLTAAHQAVGQFP